MSLLELLLALTVTAMIAGAIYGMMGAVTVGVNSRRDSRTTMVGAHAAATRLSAYIAPSRSILAADDQELTIWLNDDRTSESVHATEIRWLIYDVDAGALNVHFVSFPSDWTEVAQDIADLEYPKETDWSTVLTAYESRGLVSTMTIVDGLDDLFIGIDQAKPEDSRHAMFDLAYQTSTGTTTVSASATIRLHRPPAS